MAVRPAKFARPIMVKLQTVSFHHFEMADEGKSIGHQIDDLIDENQIGNRTVTKLVVDLDPPRDSLQDDLRS